MNLRRHKHLEEQTRSTSQQQEVRSVHEMGLATSHVLRSRKALAAALDRAQRAESLVEDQMLA